MIKDDAPQNRNPANSGKLPEALLQLTAAELRVMRVIGEGNSDREAASILGLSQSTVQSHRRNIVHKLKVSKSANWCMRQCGLAMCAMIPCKYSHDYDSFCPRPTEFVFSTR